MKCFERRAMLGLAASITIASAGLLPDLATAQDYPTKPVTMLVGYGAGGQTDLVARGAARVLAEQLGQPVNVVNKPGAGGAVAARELTQAAPDGYTILFHSNSVVNSAPFIMDQVNFTPDDFEYAGMITAYQTGLVAHVDAPFDDLKGFIAWAKENPNFAYAALSPEARMYMDTLAEANGLEPNAVPVQSGGEMITALLGKQVIAAFSGGIHYRYPDELKTISATTTFRHPSAPDVASIEEDGYPIGMDTRTTLFLPKGTPREVLERISDALSAAADDADFKKVTDGANIPIMYMNLDEARAEIEATYAKHKGILTDGS